MSNTPHAWELWVRYSEDSPFKDKTWRLYSIYRTEPEVMRTWKAVEGPPLELKIVPLWPADTWTARVERCRCEQGEVEQ
jgi:hypothetical protein